MSRYTNGQRLGEMLGRATDAAVSELNSLDADYLLSENLDVLVHDLLTRHLPEPVAVDWTSTTRSVPSEITLTRTYDDFGRQRTITVPATRITVSCPLTGTTEILRRQASTFTHTPSIGKIKDHAVELVIEDQQLSLDLIDQQLTILRTDIDRRIDWANHDVNNHRADAEEHLRRAATTRRTRIRQLRELDAALAIPVTSTTTKRPPVPARRRHVDLKQRRTSAEYTPEPLLDKAIYDDILDVTTNWARSLERTCTPAIRALDEEALRDLLLGTLNGYWEGSAAGELFNGAGKTDILIRENGRNVFTAECKVWDGPAKASEAINQLLSYMVWRDSKAALIMFIKTTNGTATINRLHETTQEHPRHLLTIHPSDVDRRADYIFSANDEERRIELAVIPVIFPPPPRN